MRAGGVNERGVLMKGVARKRRRELEGYVNRRRHE